MEQDKKIEIVRAVFPHADRFYRRVLRNLADEKGIDWYGPDVNCHLLRLMASIIRHNETHYDQCVLKVGHWKARGIVQPVVASKLRQFTGKGEK